MTYRQISDLYTGAERARIQACVQQEGLKFSGDDRPPIKALGLGVVGGSGADIDAVIAAACGHQNAPGFTDPDEAAGDAAILGAVQGVWPTVADARYPDGSTP